MILVDSSVWIDFFRGAHNRWTQQLVDWLSGKPTDVHLGVADLVVYEVMRGFSSKKDQAKARTLLMGLDVVEIGGLSNSLRAAEHYQALRKKGFTIRSPIDVLLASYCIEHGHWLLHRDTDFDVLGHLRGLRTWAN